MEWLREIQQYLTEVLQHLNENHSTAWSGFYTSIVFAVLLPLLLYLGRRCWGRREKPEQPVSFTSTQVNNYYGNASASPDQPAIPHDPPAPEPCFLHREEELDWLNDRLLPGKVVAVCGPGGMGKSALAAQAVSKLEPGRFPDGIVFHSFYHKPSTEQALQAICAAFQVEAKAGLETTVRTVLSGRKALLILDGTEEADDLPAVLRLRGQCGVLITSRRNADALDALLELKPLDEQPAEEVFLRYSGPMADTASVAAICERLGGWPVALRIAGRYLRNTKESAVDYLKWLEQEPFKELATGQHQEENAALLLRRSVAQVSDDARLVLGMAGCLAFASIGGGWGISPWDSSPWGGSSTASLARGPAAAILDDDERRARTALGELVTYGLLERQGERWQISHALIHTYARSELALSKESLELLAGWYIGFCEAQSQAGLEGYLRLDAERAHCLRLMESCLDGGLWEEVKYLVQVLQEYLDRQGYWMEAVDAKSMRLTAARHAGDHKDEGECLNSLGYTCDSRGELDKALSYYEQCLPIRRELGDRQGEGVTLNNMAGIYDNQGKYKLALEYYQQDLKICREGGDREGEGTTLNNIGLLYMHQGEWEQALPYFEQCLPVTREAGDEVGEGTTLNNIGSIYRAQGKPAKAVEYYKKALAIAQQLGNRDGEARTLWNIGLTYEDLGDLAKAEEHISQAVQIEEAIGHPDLENDRKALAQVRAARQGVRSLPRRKGLAGLWGWLRGRRRG